MVMNQNNAMLMVIALTLALVAVLAIAPILNDDEMAYAEIVLDEEPEVLAVAQVHQPQ
jgi:hypothetical protein